MVTTLWVLFDLLVVAWTSFFPRELTGRKKALVAVMGLAVAGYSGYSEHADSVLMSSLRSQLTSLHEQLTASENKRAEGEQFHRGQLDVLGVLSARTLEILASKANLSVSAGPDAVANAAATTIDQLGEQVAELRAQLAHISDRRHLTEDQKNAMKDILEANPAQYDISWARTSEAGQYAEEIINFLGTHKWGLSYRAEAPQQYDPSHEISGIYIGVKDKDHPPPSALVLAKAFKKAGITFGIADRSSVDSRHAWLLVGEKP